MGSTLHATVFQAAFCLLLYNIVQVLRGYIALAQPQPCVADELSAQQILDDVQREPTAVSVLLPPAIVVSAYTVDISQEALCQRLRVLLGSLGRRQGIFAQTDLKRNLPVARRTHQLLVACVFNDCFRGGTKLCIAEDEPQKGMRI